MCVFRVEQVTVVAKTVSSEVCTVADAEKTKKMRWRAGGRKDDRKEEEQEEECVFHQVHLELHSTGDILREILTDLHTKGSSWVSLSKSSDHCCNNLPGHDQEEPGTDPTGISELLH